MIFHSFSYSELTTRFAWLFDAPFTLAPPEGTLPPKSKCTILATFKPTAAVVYETVVECHYGDAHMKTLRLEGIGMLLQLSINSYYRKLRNKNNVWV